MILILFSGQGTWRFCTTGRGARFATTNGTQSRRISCADNSGTRTAGRSRRSTRISALQDVITFNSVLIKFILIRFSLRSVLDGQFVL